MTIAEKPQNLLAILNNGCSKGQEVVSVFVNAAPKTRTGPQRLERGPKDSDGALKDSNGGPKDSDGALKDLDFEHFGNI